MLLRSRKRPVCTDRWAHQAKSAKRDPRHIMKNHKDNVGERKQAVLRLSKVASDIPMTQTRPVCGGRKSELLE